MSVRASVSVVFVSSLAVVAACGGGSRTTEGDVAADFHDGSRLTFPMWRTAQMSLTLLADGLSPDRAIFGF